MHTTYRVDISTFLIPPAFTSEDETEDPDVKVNTLEITFHSALLRGRDIIASYPEHKLHVRQTEASRVPVRKAQYHWGWDWGPILMTAGPWRPILLETYVARVEDIWVEYRLSEDLETCEGEICARVEGVGGDWVVVSLRGEAEGEEVVQDKVRVESTNGGIMSVKVPFTLKSPALWYLHGYGAQSRYIVSAELLTSDDTPLDLTTKLIGSSGHRRLWQVLLLPRKQHRHPRRRPMLDPTRQFPQPHDSRAVP
jgi:beta-mannosidase